MKKLFVVLSLAAAPALPLMSPINAARADVVAPANVAPVNADARHTYDEMRARYTALETYSHRLTFDAAPEEFKEEKMPAPVEFSFHQPNLYAMKTSSENGPVMSVSNGRVNYVYDAGESKSKYQVMPLPPATLGRIGLMQYMPAGPFISALLAGVDPFAPPWGEKPASFSMGEAATVSGARTQAIVVRWAKKGPGVLTLFIGKDDKLVHRIAQSDEKSAITSIFNFEDIHVNEKIPLTDFDFKPPANTRPEELADSYRAEMGMSPNIRVGQTPPSLHGKDLKNRPIRLEDYKGKVVLLDFWATWCGPCVFELPHVKAAYQKYHDQGFEIIGISFDQRRAALDKSIHENKMSWPQIFDGRMFENAANANFKVGAIPFTLLIGRDGKIAAFSPRLLLLEPAVEKALRAPMPKKTSVAAKQN